MAFKFWTLQELKGPAAIATYFTVAIVALGIFRLMFDGGQRDPLDRLAALNLSECFAAREIPINTAVTLHKVPPPTRMVNGKRIEDPENPVSAQVLTVIATGALTLDLPETGLPAEGEPYALTGKSIVLRKASGHFEFRFEGAALVDRAGADYLLQAIEPVRFGPADNATYNIRSDAQAKIATVGGVKKVIVPAETVLGTLPIGTGQALSTLQPVSAAYWVADKPPTLTPVRVSGQPGLADVSLEVNQSGVNFSAPETAMTACAIREFKFGERAGGNSGWVRAGVSQTMPGVFGSAKLMVTLPEGVLPVAREFYAPLRIAVASSDGRYIALGGFNAFGRLYAALGATLLTGVLLGSMMYFRGQQLKEGQDNAPRWFSGLFVGADNDPSLSLLQVYIWTVITLWGFFYVFLVAGNLLILTTEMMGLLGIAGTGSVLARWIAVGTGGSTSQNPAAPATSSVGPAPASQSDFWRMLSTNGNFDLLKLQLFAFTIVIAMYVIWRIAEAGAFPVLDTNTLLLMGISQGVYISSKLVGATVLSKAKTLKLDLDLGASYKQQLLTEKSKLEDEKKDLDSLVAKVGAAVPADLQIRLDANKAALDKNAVELNATEARLAKLKIDYSKALADLELKP